MNILRTDLKGNITYRIAKVEDTDLVADFHSKFFEKGRNEEKIDWIWNSNPAGSAICVLAMDGKKLVGTQCILPYWLKDDTGRRIFTGKSEDTCVHPEYRKKGIFRSMYKHLIQAAKENGIQSIWGFTSATAPFENIGFKICDAYSMAIYGSGYFETWRALSSGLSLSKKIKVAIFLLGMTVPKKSKSVTVEQEDIKDILGEIVTLEQAQGLSIEMSKQHVTWRILNNPYYQKVYCLTYREAGNLSAYLVFHINETVAYIIHDSCDRSLSAEMVRDIIASFSKKILQLEVTVIKNWLFNGSELDRRRSKSFKDSGYSIAQTGSHFVWLPLNEQISIERKDLYLTRIASLGTR